MITHTLCSLQWKNTILWYRHVGYDNMVEREKGNANAIKCSKKKSIIFAFNFMQK